MRLPNLGRLIVTFGILLSSSVFAAESMVTITSPMEGATLDAKAKNMITYEVVQGDKGSHSHLYVDDKEIAVLRKLKGSHKLPKLDMGEHNICVKVVDKGHTPIGVEKCIKVMVQ